ncbi:MAG: N-acetyl-alpha-D-glucosaminyl L-malate synthase BshA [Gemmatimonadota bacterium]
MKIGITCYPTYGGSGAVATELGIQLAERGHEVHFVSYAQPFRLGHFRERVYFHEVEMEQYPLFEHPPYTLALAVALHETAVKEDLDLLHVHYAIPHATSAWIARQMMAGERSVPVVTTLHGTDITLTGLHPSFHAITRFSILRSQGITAPSEFLKVETVRDFGVPAERLHVIRNFVDTEIFRPGKEPCHRATLAPDGEKIVMHISNFRPVKRVVDTVEIFDRIRRKIPARMVLIGDGPDRPRVRERAEELGVDDQIVFLGKHASVDELLACADLFLLPSASESFGLGALEAMASGAPVVASRTGGIPEVVPHGEAGFLCEVGDVDAMGEAAVDILGDEALHERFSAAGRQLALDHFDASEVVPLYEDYYRRVLEENGA